MITLALSIAVCFGCSKPVPEGQPLGPHDIPHSMILFDAELRNTAEGKILSGKVRNSSETATPRGQIDFLLYDDRGECNMILAVGIAPLQPGGWVAFEKGVADSVNGFCIKTYRFRKDE
jgi:hypothetical protein